jgi:hypothetical protein
VFEGERSLNGYAQATNLRMPRMPKSFASLVKEWKMTGCWGAVPGRRDPDPGPVALDPPSVRIRGSGLSEAAMGVARQQSANRLESMRVSFREGGPRRCASTIIRSTSSSAATPYISSRILSACSTKSIRSSVPRAGSSPATSEDRGGDRSQGPSGPHARPGRSTIYCASRVGETGESTTAINGRPRCRRPSTRQALNEAAPVSAGAAFQTTGCSRAWRRAWPCALRPLLGAAPGRQSVFLRFAYGTFQL